MFAEPTGIALHGKHYQRLLTIEDLLGGIPPLFSSPHKASRPKEIATVYSLSEMAEHVV